MKQIKLQSMNRSKMKQYPLSADIFLFLAVGLARFFEEGKRYPYPSEFQKALHHLSFSLGDKYPKTITDLLHLFNTKPLKDWWIGELPDGIDPRFELCFDDRLDDAIADYLIEHDMKNASSLQNLQIVLDNQRIQNILLKLREVFLTDPTGASQEYKTLREYLILHPWTNAMHLRQTLSPHLRYFDPKQISDLFYLEAHTLPYLLHRPPSAQTASYWNCTLCGPLYLKHNRLGSIKPSACMKRCPSLPGWQPIDPQRYPLIIREGIHLRTHIPGIIEIQLYQWLAQQIAPQHSSLQEIHLWPAVDRCDLFLLISSHILAIDVKDYRNPYALAKTIKHDQRDQIPGLPDWKTWLYVYPAYRELQDPDYYNHVIQACGPLPVDVVIMNDTQFKRYIHTLL
jgi:REase associating with pPIWI_RE